MMHQHMRDMNNAVCFGITHRLDTSIKPGKYWIELAKLTKCITPKSDRAPQIVLLEKSNGVPSWLEKWLTTNTAKIHHIFIVVKDRCAWTFDKCGSQHTDRTTVKKVVAAKQTHKGAPSITDSFPQVDRSIDYADTLVISQLRMVQ